MAGQGASLKSYLLTRLALVIPMVFILLTFVFLLMRVAPGNAVSASLGGHAPPAVIKQISHQLGYDKPLYVQYGNYLWDILRGNFGQTISDRRPVQGCRQTSNRRIPKRHLLDCTWRWRLLRYLSASTTAAIGPSGRMNRESSSNENGYSLIGLSTRVALIPSTTS